MNPSDTPCCYRPRVPHGRFKKNRLWRSHSRAVTLAGQTSPFGNGASVFDRDSAVSPRLLQARLRTLIRTILNFRQFSKVRHPEQFELAYKPKRSKAFSRMEEGVGGMKKRDESHDPPRRALKYPYKTPTY
ncbi:hypothetical protein [Candidatus Burkholderia verschuerenii]|uniref:hypothetical protein n=1 Tax=Candidatus Burkholderia verschuerenii TaxID=242163 RepID=UPI0012EE8928|nr:hypothetical protein [Candidatus Burkholderia verschuerenii]